MIKGGYYLKARQIQESEIAHAPPCTREVWDYLLKECNHTDRKINGTTIKRGQCIRTFKQIREDLHWHIGWCKKLYTKHQIEDSMKLMRKWGMITTRKTTRGLVITIVKYDHYQNPDNYKRTREGTTKQTDSGQTADTINNNDNTLKNKTTEEDEGNMKTPTKQMISIFTSIFKEFRDGTPQINRGKDGAICKSLYKQCLADRPSNPLSLWEERIRTLMTENDIASLGGVKAFWNTAIPKKKDKKKKYIPTGA